MTERVVGELHQSCASPAPPVEEEMGDSGPGSTAGAGGRWQLPDRVPTESG